MTPISMTSTKTTNWLERQVQPHPRLLDPSPIPPRYDHATLADVPYPSLVTTAREYGKRFWDVAPLGQAPLLLGVAQTWKTHAAAVLASKIRELYQLNVGWCNCASELPRLDRDAFLETTRTRIQYMKTVPFLVMDDFSQVKQGAGRQLDIMVEIGTDRFDNLRPTLWTGNLTITKEDRSALVNAVGTCLARRMLEASEGFRVMLRRSKESS
jgi:hypothetical protein